MPDADRASTPATLGRTVRIGSVKVTDTTAPELIELIAAAMHAGYGLRLCYANAHAVRLAAEDPAFARDLARADVTFCDGVGVKLAARILGAPLRASLTPPQWIGPLIERLGSRARLYLVGDEADVVAAAADRLRQQYPDCAVIGAHHGFFRTPGPEHQQLLAEIARAGPSIVLVGMGMPRQERWANLVADQAPQAVVIAVGALFRRLIGLESRPPRWISASGFEWLVRLSRHPVAMFDRYVIGLPRFGLIVAHDWYSRRRR